MKYDDIINLPRPISRSRPRMKNIDRAAQFMPFMALNGYGGVISETERLTEHKIEFDEEEKTAINEKLKILSGKLASKPPVSITHFVADMKKEGGAYVMTYGTIKKIDDITGKIIMTDGISIKMDDITAIDSEIFQ